MPRHSDVRFARIRSAADWLAGRLARVTSGGEFVPEIDGLRFIAIGGVVFFHMMSMYLPTSGRSGPLATPEQWRAAMPLSWVVMLAYCGRFGVELFFVLSGFILALPFARRAFADQPRPDLRAYYLRRVTRLEPPYLVSLLLCFLLVAHETGAFAALLPHLFASMLYGHSLVYGRGSVLNPVTWSLEVEIQFYLLVPLLVQVFAIRRVPVRRALLVAAILGMALVAQYYVDVPDFPRLRRTLVNYLHFFLAGFLLADWYLTRAPSGRGRSFAWDIVVIAGFANLMALVIVWPSALFLAPLMVVLVCTGCFLGRVSNRLVTMRWTVIIGGMCYTLYLYHPMIISWASRGTMRLSSTRWPLVPDLASQCLLIYPMILVISGLLFVFAEKPFMRRGRSYRR